MAKFPRVPVAAMIALGGVAVGYGSAFGIGAMGPNGVSPVAASDTFASPVPSSSPDGPGFTSSSYLTQGPWTVDADAELGLAGLDFAAKGSPAAFDDGIAPQDLPPLAARPSSRYPVAHVMTDAVWDHVGPGWGLATFGQRGYYGDESSLRDLPSVLYLVSPEGTYFRLRDIPSESEFPGVQVSYWNPETQDVLLGSGLRQTVNLRTGVITERGGSGEGHYFGTGLTIAGPFAGGGEFHILTPSDAEGNALPQKFEWWSAEQGTVAIAAPPSPLDEVYGVIEVSTDGKGLVLPGADGDYLFTAATGTWTHVTPMWPTDAGSCWSVSYDMTAEVVACGDYSVDQYSTYRVPFNGGAATLVDSDLSLTEIWLGPLGVGATPSTAVEGAYGTLYAGLFVASSSTVAIEAVDLGVSAGVPLAKPVRVSEGAWVIPLAGSGVLGYDVDSGAVFAIAPPIIPDTGQPSAFLSYFVLTANAPAIGME